MKKLMIAVAIVCAAAFAQAATCQWGSGAFKTAEDATGGWSSVGVAKAQANALVTMNVYFIDAATYSDLAGKTQKELFDAYSTKTADLTGVNRNPSTATSGDLIGAVTIQDAAKAVAGEMYAVVTATYTDANYGNMYMATTAKSLYNESTQKGSANNIFASVADWQAAAVPEPTSGLLLLLGVAGLALRRRRA